jgi:hypothetical protein
MKKAHYIVNTSSTIGKISHYENSLAVWQYFTKGNTTLLTKNKWKKF